MKEYQEPVMEVVELSEEDIIVTSSPMGTGEGTETNPGSIFGANGLYFD